MQSPKSEWHRRPPPGHGRFQLTLIALVAFVVGLVVGPTEAWALRAPRAGQAIAAPAASTPGADAAAGALAATTPAQRRALELYRAGERAVAPVDRRASRQAAMDAYRQAEIAARSVVGAAEQRRALELYRAEERMVTDGRLAQRRAYELYRRGELAARTAPARR